MSPDTQDMMEAIKNGIENNATEAPAMSIDPKTQQVSVVGDPNKIDETKGDYKIKFVYSEEDLSEEDKAKMKKNENGEYEAVMTYTNKRVKPLHRTKVAMVLAKILAASGVLLEDGSYTTDTISRKTEEIFINQVDDLAEIAKIVLDIPESQLGYIDAYGLIDFFLQLLANEPNIVKESASFLEPSLIQSLAKMMIEQEKTAKPTNTQQN